VSCGLPAAFCACRHKRKRRDCHLQKGARRIAIYHCSIKIISRGKGKSAVAAAAYRSGEVITNEYDGVTHDYTAKRGIVHTEILLPDHAPAEYSDRAVLWNAVEKIEKAKNSQLAREIELALPVELTREQNISLVREYVKKHFVEQGMCADICIHDKQDENPHAHIMLTMRPFEQSGEWGAKSKKEYILDGNDEKITLKSGEFKTRKICTVDWNEQTKAEEWRQAWADCANAYLERGNHAERIDHRSYERQGIDLIPTVHLGVAAFQMEKRGIATERGNKNREIDGLNKQLRQIKARIRQLEDWVKKERAAPPTLWEVFSEITNHPEHRTQKQQIADIKLAAQTLTFIQTYKIDTLADMAAAVQNLRAKYNEMHNTLVSMSRRYHTLTEHIAQAESYVKFSPVYKRFMELKGEKQDAYFNKHREGILAFKAAHDYMTRHLNGRTKIPLDDWKRELAGLTAQREELLAESGVLTAELRSAETIKRNAEKVMGAVAPKRRQDIEI